MFLSDRIGAIVSRVQRSLGGFLWWAEARIGHALTLSAHP
jgi:hypothetical protein